ncbi:kinase-like domain-containing protein [Mycena crocata]|nr:kinase-like domain-containing protein [Mycena crocata]
MPSSPDISLRNTPMVHGETSSAVLRLFRLTPNRVEKDIASCSVSQEARMARYVFRAVHPASHHVLACKVLSSPEPTEQEWKRWKQEVYMLSQLQHPNVIAYVASALVKEHHAPVHEGVYILLEFADRADLLCYMRPSPLRSPVSSAHRRFPPGSDGGFHPDLAHFYFTQLVSAMASSHNWCYIHSQGVVHCDIKPENLLLDHAFDLKVSDFGLSCYYKHFSWWHLPIFTVRRGEGLSGPPLDVWSAGVVLFFLIVADSPWDLAKTEDREFADYLRGEAQRREPWTGTLGRASGRSHPSSSDATRCKGQRSRRFPGMYGWSSQSSHPSLTVGFLISRPRPNRLFGASPEVLARELQRPFRSTISAIPSSSPPPVVGPPPSSPHTSEVVAVVRQFSQPSMLPDVDGRTTRFFSSCTPEDLFTLVVGAIRYARAEVRQRVVTPALWTITAVGGYAQGRHCAGRVEIRLFRRGDFAGSSCLMRRTQGCESAWRHLWKAVVLSPFVEGSVYRSPSVGPAPEAGTG